MAAVVVVSLPGCHLCQALAHSLVLLSSIQWSYLVLWLADFPPSPLLMAENFPHNPVISLTHCRVLPTLEEARAPQERGMSSGGFQWAGTGHVTAQSRVISR